MRLRRNVYHSLMLSTTLLLPAVLSAALQDMVLQPKSALWLEGDSSLHTYTSRATKLSVEAQVDPQTRRSGKSVKGLVKAVIEQGALKQFQLIILAKGLQSKDARLDANMYKALKADQFPEIVFRLSNYEVHPSTANLTASEVNVTGVLSVAGIEQAVHITAEALSEPLGLRVQGQHALLMSEYGIKPPTMIMGTIKTRDKVVIHFDLLLQ